MLSQRKCILADRYVPIRRDLSSDYLSTGSHITQAQENNYENTKYANLINNPSKRCLSFKKKTHISTDCTDQKFGKDPFERLKTIKLDLKLTKTVTSTQAIGISHISDNFYHNLLDWSKDEVICLGIEDQIYLKKTPGAFSRICSQNVNFINYKGDISSVKCNKEGNLIYTGYQKGSIQIFDIQKQVLSRSIVNNHFSRVGCLENTYEWGFLSGSKDKSIIHHDIRLKNTKIFKVLTHKDEVLGLTVNQNKVASSSSDGKVFIWSLTQGTKPIQNHSLHKDAVKSVKWCPWKINLLASGGGKNDHTIILWNSQNQSVQKIIQGNTQITCLEWNDQTKDLVSGHSGLRQGGYVTVWNYKIQQFTHILVGHTSRILSLKLNQKNKNEIISLGADKLLKFWNIRNKQSEQRKRQSLKTRISLSNVVLK